MAKRARGSTTSRPGQRPPLQRSPIRPGGSTTRSSATVAPAVPLAPPPATLTDAEEAGWRRGGLRWLRVVGGVVLGVGRGGGGFRGRRPRGRVALGPGGGPG